jgi:hypothetical protein
MFIFGNTQSDPHRNAVEEALNDFDDALAKFNTQPGFIESLLHSDVLNVITDVIPALSTVGTVMNVASLGFSLFEDPKESFEKAKEEVIKAHEHLLLCLKEFCETEVGEELRDVSPVELSSVLGSDLTSELRRADRELKRVQMAKSKALTPETARKIARTVPRGLALINSNAKSNGVQSEPEGQSGAST